MSVRYLYPIMGWCRCNLAISIAGHFAGSKDGTFWPRKCASKHELR
jgi:hypothetical protein